MGTKKIYLALVILVVLFAVTAPTFADAGFNWKFWEWPNEIAGALAEFLVKAIITAIAIIPAFIFFLVAGVTTWFIQLVMDIGVAPSSGATPAFVREGWEFSRQFVNMFFLLILVFIGLATILRLKEYELQKTLPKLIGIALLVNFSGVFVGLIVDIGNLLTNFFISSTGAFGSGSFTDIWNTGSDYVDTLGGGGAEPLEILVSGVVYGLVLWIFYAVSALAYFAVFLIFFLRQIILWVLVILAPIAFASYILPATRGWWTRWLGSLTQWAFVGIPIGFFLWLSNRVMNPDPSDPLLYGTTQPVLTGDMSVLSTLIVAMLTPFTGMVLLLVGITLSLSMAPSSIKVVTNFVKKAAVVTGGILGAQAIMRLAESKKVRGAADRWSSSANPKWGYDKDGKARGGIFAATQRGVGGMTGFGKRVTGKPVGRLLTKGEKTAEEKAKKDAMQANDFELRSLLEQAGTGAQKRGVWQAILQRKRARQIFDTDTMSGTKQDREFQRARLEEAALGAHDNALAEGDDDTVEKSQRVLFHNDRAIGHMASREDQRTANAQDTYNDKTGITDPETGEYLPGVTQAEYDQGIKNFRTKIFRGTRTAEEFREYQRRGALGDDFMELLHSKHSGAQKVAAFATAWGEEGVRKLEAAKKPGPHYFTVEQVGVELDAGRQPIHQKNGDGTDKLYSRGNKMSKPVYGLGGKPGVARWEAGTGGQNLGASPKEGAETTTLVRDLEQLGQGWAKHYQVVEREYKVLQNILTEDVTKLKQVIGTDPARERQLSELLRNEQRLEQLSDMSPVEIADLDPFEGRVASMLSRRREIRESMLGNPDQNIRDVWIKTDGMLGRTDRDFIQGRIRRTGGRGGRGGGGTPGGGGAPRGPRGGAPGGGNLDDMGNPVISPEENQGPDNLDDMGNPVPPNPAPQGPRPNTENTGAARPIPIPTPPSPAPPNPRPSNRGTQGNATRPPRTNEKLPEDDIGLGRYYRATFGNLEGSSIEDFRRSYTPEIQNKFQAWAKQSVQNIVKDMPRGSRTADTVASVLGNSPGVFQRIVSLKEGRVVDIEKLLSMPFSQAAKEYLDIDLPKDYFDTFSARPKIKL